MKYYIRRKKNLTHKNEEPNNHFNRLPDDLLIVVFNKLIDAKTLIRCSSVSKRFGCLIPQTETVFLRINSFTVASLYALYVLFKNKFRNVKSLQIECQFDNNSYGVGVIPFLRWKVVLGANLETCVFLFALSMNHCTSTTDSGIGVEEIIEKVPEFLSNRLQLAFTIPGFFLKHVLPYLGSLQNVVISDGTGKLCIGDEQLAELRSYSMNLWKGVQGPLHAKHWYVPVLKLPLSGYTVNMVMLTTIRCGDQPIIMEKDVQLLTDAFVDEGELGKVYDEVVMEMVKNKKKKTYELAIP